MPETRSRAHVPNTVRSGSCPPNIALIGCGAIAQAFYLPALSRLRNRFKQLWLIDPADRARAAAGSFIEGREARHFSDVDDDIQMVLIAAPNQFHYSLAREAIAAGADVLLEKPFVVSPDEGQSLIATAEAADRVIAINQTRRLFPLTGELRGRITAGEFGRLEAIVHYEGTKLAWPFESGAGFSRNANRTGVIMDFGVHVIDFYHYLFQPSWTFCSAIHDGFNGPEGLANIELRADDAPISIRLSRYQTQENVAHLMFEHAEVSFGVHDDTTYMIRRRSGRATTHIARCAEAPKRTHSEALLLNFFSACERRERPFCDPTSSLPVIVILDEIYRQAGRYRATVGSI